MEYLRKDPKNTLIIVGDHGNHYGYYAIHTAAGIAENGGPPLVFIIHPETLNNVDEYKSRTNRTSLQNFMSPRQSLTTPFDFFLTLCDVMRLDCNVNIAGNYSVQPSSVFDTCGNRTIAYLPHAVWRQ